MAAGCHQAWPVSTFSRWDPPHPLLIKQIIFSWLPHGSMLGLALQPWAHPPMSSTARPWPNTTKPVPRNCKAPCTWVICFPNQPWYVFSKFLFLRAITEPLRRIANGLWLPVAACGSATPFPPYPLAPQTWVFRAFWQGFATQRWQEPLTVLARLACHAASQSQLGSFAATKFIPEDPLLGVAGSHHQAMLCSHPRISPTSSARTGRSHVVAHARVGWERPCSHGTAAWPDPLRMLQPGRPRPLVIREEPAGFSLAPGGGLVVPTTSQTHIPQWHQLLSPAGPGATGHVLAGQGWVRWVCALLTPRRCFGDCQGGGSSWGRS